MNQRGWKWILPNWTESSENLRFLALESFVAGRAEETVIELLLFHLLSSCWPQNQRCRHKMSQRRNVPIYLFLPPLLRVIWLNQNYTNKRETEMQAKHECLTTDISSYSDKDYLSMQIYTHIHTHTHTCKHTHAHKYTHDIHTHIYIHILSL